MDQELRAGIAHWLTSMGIDTQPSDGISSTIMVIACLIIAFAAYFFVKRGVVTTMNLVIQRSKAHWDDIFMRHQVLEKMAVMVPILILNILMPLALSDHKVLSSLSDRFLDVTIVVLFVRAIYSALDAANEIADYNLVSRRLPIKSFVQLAKLFMFFVAIIISISVLADQSPVYFLSGLGVATGLVMLVFRDTILGFVAGIQLAANRMVSPGDWIEMDNYGANGTVEEVSLTTVKVRNFDQTLTMLPAYSLTSGSFRNWRGMSESGGRRIKRAVQIDIQSVRFLTESDMRSLSKINYLKDYFSSKSAEIITYNAQVEDADMYVNSRHLTNLGTFRAYIQEYLTQHDKIRKDMTLMVRQLAPTELGVPIELYIFTNDTRWEFYEGIQADIFDHIFAILPEFDLRVYQGPTGADIRSLRH
ncbi:small conductance mechanosensitive ion channel protein YbdG [Shewanella sairae]|uniref:Small conductance mechanosensitive ion channel protein YbdG n=1 Tax=Shewanella sairae TaxID=190310 RepID=A0ABQ4P3Y4_9GAMM|nr:mechanosensitive ion channel domain-containing protein [Shewanella sairae]MCL1128528.1 mechanosensitive ion channel family protein [Shewanella sairae]GIU42133.1 small conductance mechanosensitive ion channel protein YbdG [Shewanella sairae]